MSVYSHLKLVSPGTCTLHAGEVIRVYSDDKGSFYSFKSNGLKEDPATIGANVSLKYALVRTGAHFQRTRDCQFITVVYSGSGRIVMPFDTMTTTNILMPLYVKSGSKFTITNDKTGTEPLGLALFDVPVSGSELQTDVLITEIQ